MVGSPREDAMQESADPGSTDFVEIDDPEAPDDAPAGWEAAWDSTHERFYYFNRDTQERVWSLKRISQTATAGPPAFSDGPSDFIISPKASSADAASRAECKRRTFRDLVHMQARATKELQNISETMSSVCNEMRHMRETATAATSSSVGRSDFPQVSAPALADHCGLLPSASERRWAQRRHDFQKRRCIEDLRHIFVELGLDLHRRHTHAELGDCFIKAPKLCAFFEERLHVNVDFAEEVFQLLELDSDHRASLTEFIEGCVELKDEPSVRQHCKDVRSSRKWESMQSMSLSLARAHPVPGQQIRPLEPYDAKSLPLVEVAIRVNHLANVDTNMLKFEADFTIFLDWVDERIPDGVDAHELDWESVFFNPSLVVEGIEDGPMEPTCCAVHPQFARPEKRASPAFRQKQHEWLTRGLRECKWCTKIYRFRGVLCMSEVDLRCFPFDFQMLPLKVRAQRITFGDVHNAFVRLASPESHDGATEELRIRRLCRQYNSREAKFRHNGSYCASTPNDSCMADCMVEFRIYGLYSFPARSILDAKDEAYQVTVVVKRPVLGHQLGEFMVLILLVLLSAVSFWDYAPELSSRMSITLTIILTLAAYTSQRPAAIEKVPHATVQDWLELLAMYFVMGVGVLNVVAVVCCGGESTEAPAHMQDMYLEYQGGMCAASRWGMRRVDFFSFVAFVGAVLIAIIASMVLISRWRHWNLEKKLKEGVELLELAGGTDHAPGAELEDDLPTLTSPSHSTLQDQKNWDFRIEQKMRRVLLHMRQERHRASNPSAAWEQSSTFTTLDTSRDGSRVAPAPGD